MPKEFKEVVPTDFTTFSREMPSYVLMEQALLEMGGGGNGGVAFKKDALAAAGWKYGKLVSYGAHPDTATVAFNKIRAALQQASSKQDMLDALKQS